MSLRQADQGVDGVDDGNPAPRGPDPATRFKRAVEAGASGSLGSDRVVGTFASLLGVGVTARAIVGALLARAWASSESCRLSSVLRAW